MSNSEAEKREKYASMVQYVYNASAIQLKRGRKSKKKFVEEIGKFIIPDVTVKGSISYDKYQKRAEKYAAIFEICDYYLNIAQEFESIADKFPNDSVPYKQSTKICDYMRYESVIVIESLITNQFLFTKPNLSNGIDENDLGIILKFNNDDNVCHIYCFHAHMSHLCEVLLN